MKVKQAMHKGVQWVNPRTSVEKLATLMREHDIGAIPIGENDRLVGMVTDRDIVCRCIAAGLDPNTATARDVMSEGIVFCLVKQELDDAALRRAILPLEPGGDNEQAGRGLRPPRQTASSPRGADPHGARRDPPAFRIDTG